MRKKDDAVLCAREGTADFADGSGNLRRAESGK
jgi:hypothetical protein